MKYALGWHGWMPGFAGEELSADPNWIWVKRLAKYLVTHDYGSFWLGRTHANHCMPLTYDLKMIDVGIFYWRWPMPVEDRYKDRNQAFLDQVEMLTELSKLGKPIIVFDGDYKITYVERQWLKELGAFVVAPAFYPPSGYHKLFYPYFGGTLESIDNLGQKIVYIGNNYERYAIAKKYLAFTSNEDPKVYFYGNWLEPSSTREKPEVVLEDFPHARFYDRLPQSSVTPTLQEYDFTIHLGKRQYMESGFLALRWMEAVEAGIPAIVPTEYRLPNIRVSRAGSRYDVKQLVKSARKKTRFLMWREQKEMLEQHCKPRMWDVFLQTVLDGRST